MGKKKLHEIIAALLIFFIMSSTPIIHLDNGHFLQFGQKAYASSIILSGFNDVWVSPQNYNMVSSDSFWGYYTQTFLIRRQSDNKLFFGWRVTSNDQNRWKLHRVDGPSGSIDRLNCWDKNGNSIASPAFDPVYSIVPKYWQRTDIILYVYPVPDNLYYMSVNGNLYYNNYSNWNAFDALDAATSMGGQMYYRIDSTNIGGYINQLPALNIMNPSENCIFYEGITAFNPIISVSDVDNDTLTCKYYVDSETIPRGTETATGTSTAKQVTFNSALNMSTLTEGNHTLKFEVSDGICPIVTSTVNIRVDKSAPTLGNITTSSSYNSITLSGSATDSIAGLDPYPYRYTIRSSPTGWLNAASYTFNSLTPNTQYAVKFEARDAKNHIAESIQSVYTKAQSPSITVGNATSTTLDISTSDSNPVTTQYQVSVNNGAKYVTPEGTLTTSVAWLTFPANKILRVTGLTSDTPYTFTVKARNAEGVETTTSTASGTTLVPPPAPPANITATATNSSIAVSWDAVPNASGYDIEADGVVKDNGTSTAYTHTGLTQNTQHTYRVRAKGAGGAGDWSAAVTKSTLPNIPGVPINIVAAPSANSITIIWDSVGGATGYDIEADGEVINNGPTTNYTHKGLAPGTHHAYRIRSINAGGKSAWSYYINASTLPEAPMIPSNLRATPSKTEIALAWDAVAGASYDIEVDGTAIDNGTRTTYTHTGLAAGTQHNYRVRAKKAGTAGEWSTALTVSTSPDIFGIPSNVKAEVYDTSVQLSWDSVTGAVYYEVDADNSILNNGPGTVCIHSGLQPGTQHSYKVRAVDNIQVSGWSSPVTITTYQLSVTGSVYADASETSITVNWAGVAGADAYDAEVNGVITENITGTTYTFGGLPSNTQYAIRIRAKNASGMGAWSKTIYKSTLLGSNITPDRITAISRADSITVIWNGIEGTGGYDMEADGAIIGNIAGTNYTHTGLLQGTSHTYRVRAKNANGAGVWSKAITVSTLPSGPVTPANINISATTTSVLLTWNECENATGYEIEADGVLLDAGASTAYTITGLNPGTQHTYRIRSKNINGVSLWSDIKTISTRNSTESIQLACTLNDVFSIAFSALDINSPDRYTYTITYNASELEVIDLCAATTKADTETGPVTGSDIKVIQFAPGTIVFIKTAAVSPGEAWSGYINSIKFKSKINGNSIIKYSIQ